MTEKRLGSEDNKRLTEWKTDLASRQKILKSVSHLQDVPSPEKMEVVGGGGAVGHDVVDVDQLLDGELVSQLGEILGVI